MSADKPTPAETWRQEIRRLMRIMQHFQRLSPAGQTWLLARLKAEEAPRD